MRFTDGIFLLLVILGVPNALILSLLGINLGDGTGNESGIAGFFGLSFIFGVINTFIAVSLGLFLLFRS